MFRSISKKLGGSSNERKMIEEAEKQRKDKERLEKRRHEIEMEEKRERERMKGEKDEKERRRGAIMDVTESSAQVVDFSQGTMGLVDRLEAHPAGKMLKNTVISNEPPPDRELNIQRLRTFKPQNDFAKLSLHEIPPIELTEEFSEFPITSAMTSSQFNDLKNYVLVSDIFFHYIPLDSFYSRSAPVHFQVNDFRKVDNTCMRQYPLSHTGGYNVLMTLDYCVAKRDLHHLSYSVSTSLNSFRKGVIWGSVKVVLTLSHMDFPVKSNITETMGVLHLSDSDLREFISDPRHSDGVITPQALTLLRQHYKRGEIENINLPRDDKKEVNVAMTTIGGGDEHVDVRDLMSGMRGRALSGRPLLSQIEPPSANSSSPDSTPRKKSSMKKNIMKRPMSPFSEDANDDDGLANLQEIEFGEDNDGNSSSTIDSIPRRPDTPQKGVRAISFA
jgi:hypothetical protein